MPEIFIRCPNTGKVISTGMAMDQRSFERATGLSVGCPACGKVHTFTAKDAVKPN